MMTFKCNLGVSDAVIDKFELSTSLRLPRDYGDFLRRCNGGEGFVGDDYVMLWRLEDIETFNHEYQVDEYLPGFLLIGSSGGGEAYCFKTGDGSWMVGRVPFVGMSERRFVTLAASFSEFWALPRKL
jgi:hypothetical protein